jgi:hypothetical protein
MLITPSLLHVKTHTGRGRQEPAVRLQPQGAAEGYGLDGMTAEAVLERLDAPVMARGPEATEWQCTRDDHAAMADAGEWDDLLDALRFADQDRTMASGGYRVAPLISEGIRARLFSALDAGDFKAADDELARFNAVQAMHPEDYAAAHLMAQALIDIGAAKHGLAADSDIAATLLAESAAHFAAAESLLFQFDPIEEMSPLLAATRYHLVRWIDDGRELFRDWYEDWVDLDPEDAIIHATHAVNMLPDGFGSVAAFEKAARKACSLTDQLTGKAAYAIFHLTAIERLGTPMPSMDMALFLQGLGDFQTATGCQYRANVAANILTELLRDYRLEGPAAAYQLTKVRAALSDVLWNRLHEVHLESWEHGADSLAFALGEVFGPALQRGARITRRGEGLGTRVPRA